MSKKKRSSVELIARERMVEYAHFNLPNIAELMDLHSPTYYGFYDGEEDRPSILLNTFTNPDYFYFLCKQIFNIELLPVQCAILRELWVRPFPMLIASRGFGKSFMLALYCMIRMLLTPGAKIVIVGAAFRQSKIIFDYMDTIWSNAPILQNMCGSGKREEKQGPRRDIDRCTMNVGNSWACAIPLGDGTKIRGLRAHYIVADEFACLGPKTLVETDRGLMRIGDMHDVRDVNLFTGEHTLEKPENFIQTPVTKAYKVTTTGGYNFICSGIHTVDTINGFKLAKDLTTDDMLFFENQYIFPQNNITHDGLEVNEDLAWLMGLLLAEGYINSKHSLYLKMNDEASVNRFEETINRLFPGQHVTRCQTDAYTDSRGWDCKNSHVAVMCCLEIREKLIELGLPRSTAHTKTIPWSILQSPRNVVISFLSGLFEGDGSAFAWKDRQTTKLGISYYSVCEQLCDEVQVLLRKLDIFSNKQSRASKLSEHKQWMIRMNGPNAWKLFDMLDVKKWKDIDIPRQTVFAKKFDNPSYLKVKSVEQVEDQVLYDFYLPETHSFMANCFRQHNSIPEATYETVVAGFAVVSANPVDNVKVMARKKLKQELDVWSSADQDGFERRTGNQAILSGTAYYDFNHFAKYWKQYKAIVNSRGDERVLQEIFNGELPDNFNWKDYSVIRIPYDLLPPGFMDEKHVLRSKATVHSGVYQMEFGAVFTTDSNGFFKRTLIEGCVISDHNEITLPSCGRVDFSATVRGNANRRYVYGVDPASESDRFSIVVLELWPEHRRIVYVWTTTKAEYQVRVKAQTTKEEDFYGYCARKIRQLMKVFPCERIALDSQGGGYAVDEALHDSDKMEPGEVPLWQVIDPNKEKPTDDNPGAHIIEMINFASAEWTAQANHGLRKDFEDKCLLFPAFDPMSIADAINDDKKTQRQYDTLEDCVMEIEDLKDELATIVHTQTINGRDRWDTPEVKLAGGKKGRQRKDRYSSLLMANMVGRTIQRTPEEVPYMPVGQFVDKVQKRETGGPMYIGPQWFLDGMKNLYGG